VCVCVCVCVCWPHAELEHNNSGHFKTTLFSIYCHFLLDPTFLLIYYQSYKLVNGLKSVTLIVSLKKVALTHRKPAFAGTPSDSFRV